MTISGDLGDPVDVVPVMRFLVAPETRWVTGPDDLRQRGHDLADQLTPRLARSVRLGC